MDKKTLGIIGCGNMGGAIARGVVCNTDLQQRWNVLGYDSNAACVTGIHGVRHADDLTTLVSQSDYILLAVKPYQVNDLISTIKGMLNANKTILSIAAAVPLSALQNMLDNTCPAVQIMPNTPAMVGAGVFALCLDDPILPPDRKDLVTGLFSGLGTVFTIPESKMNAFSAVAGCGPAYVFLMMDAVMEAGVTLGFTRQEATDMVNALFKGSAMLAEHSGTHPAVLHAQVTSPRGMTIAGTNHLSRTAVRGHIIDAVLVANARGKEMENE